jgi:hypothetical protein
MDRYLQPDIATLLKEKMVFLAGPRQVGKTTLALRLLGENADETHPAYLNWDNPSVPAPLRQGELPSGQRLVILDEIHKYARWRNLVKGLYDTNKSRVRFLVTGSARLDHYRKGGDSLQGRYHFLRLHPFSLLEYNPKPTPADLEQLLRFGGFPEPLFKGDETHHRLWQRQRLSRVVREDLRDLEQVKDISLVEMLVDLLPSRVGSPLSIKSLREDLEVDHKTVVRWITILENLYVCFRIAPYGAPRIRAVKKEQKLYLWDWSAIEERGPRFENMTANQLLKYCHQEEDLHGYRMELRYLRDTDKREVDFVVLKDRKPLFAVECKSGEKQIGPPLNYFAERTPIPVFYQVHLGKASFDKGKVRVRPYARFCEELSMP